MAKTQNYPHLGASTIAYELKCPSVLAVVDIIALDPLVGVLSSLGGNLRDLGWPLQVDLQPLIAVVPFRAPRTHESTHTLVVKSSQCGVMVLVPLRRGS